MKQMKYKVEAFIVPVGNDCSNDINLPKSITNVNTVDFKNRLSSCTENYSNNSFFIEEENIQNLKNTIALEKNIEAKRISITKESCLEVSKTKYNESYNIDTARYPLNVFDKIQKLMPIVERNEEIEDKFTDLCYGCRNGCSSSIPTPQAVSEKIFEENWLQKLEGMKHKEELLRNKEMTLRNREIVLFKKEREIKILELQLKNKLRQLDLQLTINRSSQGSLNAQNLQKNASKALINVPSKEVHTEEFCTSDSTETVENSEPNKLNSCMQNERVDKQDKASVWSSSGSSDNNNSEGRRVKQRANQKSITTLKSFPSKFTCNSNETKRPHKVYYEDLDTTLSADIGDSSFVQTSQKFNPELYRKPYAFTRSASERRIKHTNNGNDINLEVQTLSSLKEEFQPPAGIEEDRVLKRVAKNISASQDKNTKFQHYGLIDQNIDGNKASRIENEEQYSYLNLETGNKLHSHQKLMKGVKDRPISWNEETNEWLQKKRRAYNMNAKKTVAEDAENKENLKCNTKTNKAEKVGKKKDIKNKLFTIFR